MKFYFVKKKFIRLIPAGGTVGCWLVTGQSGCRVRTLSIIKWHKIDTASERRLTMGVMAKHS